MNYAWIGIAILILIVIALIITIVVLNRGNTIDIVNSLPNYKIFYPKGNSFLQLKNLHPYPPFQAIPIPVTFWLPFVVANNSDGLNIWVFDTKNVSSSFTPLPPNNKYVKIVNVIYNETGIGYVPISNTGPTGGSPPIPSRIGYLKQFPDDIGNPEERLDPRAGIPDGYVFRYITTGQNTFELRSTDGTKGIYVNKDGALVIGSNPPDSFQLVLTQPIK